MDDTEQPQKPIWLEAKARKKIDIVREVGKVLAETERLSASKPILEMTENDLEIEQLRLEELLSLGSMTVADFQRLREIDWYLDAMRGRRDYGRIQEEWQPGSLNE